MLQVNATIFVLIIGGMIEARWWHQTRRCSTWLPSSDRLYRTPTIRLKAWSISANKTRRSWSSVTRLELRWSSTSPTTHHGPSGLDISGLSGPDSFVVRPNSTQNSFWGQAKASSNPLRLLSPSCSPREDPMAHINKAAADSPCCLAAKKILPQLSDMKL